MKRNIHLIIESLNFDLDLGLQDLADGTEVRLMGCSLSDSLIFLLSGKHLDSIPELKLSNGYLHITLCLTDGFSD